MTKLERPFELRDLRGGINRKSAVNSYLVPDNTVSHSLNINYDTIIGSGVVRAGTTAIGSTGLTSKTPLGLTNYVSSKGTVYNNIIAEFSGASNATIYYYDSSWHASNLTALSNSAKTRFAMLGNQIFMANGADTMKSSSDGGATWGTTNSIDAGGTIKPSLLIRHKQRLIASGDTSQSPSRIFFSSVVDPTTSPGTITWSTNSTTGNWIDINPDDGDSITGMAETSNTLLVFKNYGLYRVDTINKTTDSLNIFNVGAPSQEAITTCQGAVFFFSGYGIHQTSGAFPVQISRLGVQDFLDAIPQSSWTSVHLGNDLWNIYVSCGNVTVGFTTYTNLVLKYSIRDQSWSAHTYPKKPTFFTQFTTTTGREMIASDTTNAVQYYNIGTTDNGTAIFYSLETQEIEFSKTDGYSKLSMRAFNKEISNQVIVLSQYGQNSTLSIRPDDNDPKPIRGDLNERINIIEGVKLSGNFFTFIWSGSSTGKSPIFEGIYLEDVQTKGIVKP